MRDDFTGFDSIHQYRGFKTNLITKNIRAISEETIRYYGPSFSYWIAMKMVVGYCLSKDSTLQLFMKHSWNYFDP